MFASSIAHKTLLPVSLAVLALVLAFSSASAQPFTIDWASIDGGGGTSFGGAYSLTASIGQPDAGTPLSGGIYTLTGGFLAGVGAVPSCLADFNRSGGATIQDVFDFLAAWFDGNPAADVNTSGSVSLQDIFDFLTAWFIGCP